MYSPHDLLWLSNAEAITHQCDIAGWVKQYWHKKLPVVVRRDRRCEGKIPVGIRGQNKNQRQATWVTTNDIIDVMTPVQITQQAQQGEATLHQFACFQLLQKIVADITQNDFPFDIGVTGSLAYSLATHSIAVNEQSDLDLQIICSTPVLRNQLDVLRPYLTHKLCRADIQIETPEGGFSLADWFANDEVLLKTHCGPKLVTDPWQKNQ